MSRNRVFLIAAGVAIAVTGMIFRREIKALSEVVAGKSPYCPLARAVESVRNQRRQVKIKDALLLHSRLLRRDPAGYNLWRTPRGEYWVPQDSDYALPYDLAEQERRIYGRGEHSVRPGDVVLDCGANVGVFTRVALDDGARLVVAIEPAPENLECFRRNFQREISAGRVIVCPKGVWDREDFLTIKVDPGNSAADSFVMTQKNSREGQKLPLTTIDHLVGELKLDRVDFIKMDIEGAEQRALAGARATLARFHPRMALSVYHLPDDPVKIPDLVRAGYAGYTMECGPCMSGENGRIFPTVYYFY